jgi:hypothetical protein
MMNTSEIILTGCIYFLIPLGFLAWFCYLRKQLIQKQIPDPPILELFLILLIYGLLAVTLFTGLFWKWSLTVFLGVVFIALPAPVLVAFISVSLKMDPVQSTYHSALQKAALFYFLVFPVSLFLLVEFGPKTS